MSTIIQRIQAGVLCLTLNRPEKYNAFNREMALSLQQGLDEAKKSEAIRAVLITGNGRAFSAGQDLGEVTGDNPVHFDVILSEHYNPIVDRIRQLEKPVVAAVNGVAAGAGANIALCCDIVVAAESATFIQAFSKIGLIPDSGGTFFLPRLIGFQKAAALMMLGDKVSSSDAERMGMIYRAFPDDQLMQEAEQLAVTLAQMPTQALGLTKKALNASFHNSLHEQLAYEDKLQYKAAHTKDYQEGVNAFLEKRKPVFIGQ
jgi:2-(1,2-epoxy-1,2-dihydrophenyl)acetyl-CoA isomerase